MSTTIKKDWLNKLETPATKPTTAPTSNVVKQSPSKPTAPTITTATAADVADIAVDASSKRIADLQAKAGKQNAEETLAAKELLQLEQAHKAELEAFKKRNYRAKAVEKPKDKFKVFHCPNQEYFLSYSNYDGCVLESTRKGWQGTLMFVKSKQQVQTEKGDFKNANGTMNLPDSSTVVGFKGAEFINRDLTPTEFAELVKAKPDFNVILKAYSIHAPMHAGHVQDINARLDRNSATVSF